MVLTMAILALLCHIAYKRVMRQYMMRMVRTLGYAPLNKEVLHHAGETRVFMTVVVAAYRSKSPLTNVEELSDSCKQLVCIQLCTLPHLPNQYVATHEPSIQGFITNNSNSRLANYFTFNITWDKICIRMKTKLLQMICEEMPTSVRISMTDIVDQMRDHLPHFWTHMDAIGVHRIYLVGLSGNNMIYKAGESSEGNRLERQVRQESRMPGLPAI
jgi:hypothetical protein